MSTAPEDKLTQSLDVHENKLAEMSHDNKGFPTTRRNKLQQRYGLFVWMQPGEIQFIP